MIAFVMSGGGNRGALEAGAVLELFEQGVQPDILVGTSAGALNAAFVAANPTLEGARQLADVWTNAQKDDLFPGSWFSMIGRLASGRSLFPSEPVRKFAEKLIPPDKRTFGDLEGVKLYITAANLNAGRLYLFGDQPEASIVDAAIASAAHPLAFPPAEYQDSQLVDGGVVANVPVGVAVDKGATEIYILNVGYAGQLVEDRDNVLEILNRSIGLMMYQPFLLDLKYATEKPGITLHHISMTQFQGTQMWDLEHGAEMVEAGRRAMHDYLSDPIGLGGLSFGVPRDVEPEPPAGAEPYVPPWLR
jgi:NTE family protein